MGHSVKSRSIKNRKKLDEPELKRLKYHAVKRKLTWTNRSMLYQILVKTLMIFSLNMMLLIFLLHKGAN